MRDFINSKAFDITKADPFDNYDESANDVEFYQGRVNVTDNIKNNYSLPIPLRFEEVREVKQ